MASIASPVPAAPQLSQPSKLTFVKELVEIESPGMTSIPSAYTFTTNPHDEPPVSDELAETIPIIDFSVHTSGTPDQRSQLIQELGKACQDLGCFMVINHGVPESLIEAVFDGSRRFFDLTEEEKREFEGKHLLDPIRCGTSFNASVEKVFLWRDFLKVIAHPEFHFPNKPAGFSELSFEYCKRAREVARELLKGISESLGLEPSYIEKSLIESEIRFGNLRCKLVPAMSTTRTCNGFAPSFRP